MATWVRGIKDAATEGFWQCRHAWVDTIQANNAKCCECGATTPYQISRLFTWLSPYFLNTRDEY